MGKQRWEKQIEAYFDGDRSEAEAVESMVRTRPECAEYLEILGMMREGASAQAAQAPGIANAQFAPFMDGIREGIGTKPQGGHGRFWAVLSLVAAALVMSVATWTMFQAGGEPVKATEVEFTDTELDGATTDWYVTEDGVTSVRVSISEDDLW